MASLIENFKGNVSIILIRKQMTRSELAESIGCNKSQISHVLNGRQIPTLDAVERWASALDVSAIELLHNLT